MRNNQARIGKTLRVVNAFLCLVIWFCFHASAQVRHSPEQDQGASQQQRQQLEDLRKDLGDLRKDLESLKSKLEFDEFLLVRKQDRADSISLDLTQKTYQRVDTDNGFFLVSVEDAAQYLNGYKIHLSIGNPSYATYANWKIKVRWSKPYDWSKYTQASYEEWNKAIQEKEISYPDSLSPGSWNAVDVVIAPVTADELGFLTLSMTTNSVILHTR